jgi:hypothetical protein
MSAYGRDGTAVPISTHEEVSTSGVTVKPTRARLLTHRQAAMRVVRRLLHHRILRLVARSQPSVALSLDFLLGLSLVVSTGPLVGV